MRGSVRMRGASTRRGGRDEMVWGGGGTHLQPGLVDAPAPPRELDDPPADLVLHRVYDSASQRSRRSSVAERAVGGGSRTHAQVVEGRSSLSVKPHEGRLRPVHRVLSSSRSGSRSQRVKRPGSRRGKSGTDLLEQEDERVKGPRVGDVRLLTKRVQPSSVPDLIVRESGRTKAIPPARKSS